MDAPVRGSPHTDDATYYPAATGHRTDRAPRSGHRDPRGGRLL